MKRESCTVCISKDGSVTVPKVLQPYMAGQERIEKS